MINAEFYKDEILKFLKQDKEIAVNKHTKKLMECDGFNCNDCVFNEQTDYDCCDSLSTRWLLAEHKEYSKLTRFQFELLNYMASDYEWIARDKDGSLNFYESKPEKRNENVWYTFFDEFALLPVQLDAFEFIKWEDTEPWNIQDLLENCEVEE